MISKEELKEIMGLLPKLKKLGSEFFLFINYVERKDSFRSEEIRQNILTYNIDINDDMANFSKEQIKFLLSSEIYNNIGIAGNTILNENLAKYRADENSLISELKKVYNKLAGNIVNLEFLNKILNILPEIKEDDGKLEENTGILEIHFQKECNIEGLKKLEDMAKKWDFLIKVLYELEGENPPIEILFTDIEKGSLKVYISLACTLLGTLGACTTWSLESLKSYQEIKKIKKEIEIIDMDIVAKKEVTRKLEEQSKLKRSKLADEVFEKLIEKFKDEGKEILPEVKLKAQKQFLEELMVFLEKGGEISIKTNEETEKEIEVSQLYKEINLQIESYQEQRYIEYKTQEENK